ncbi:MAG: hypothetical protein H7144_01780 [Burkholderiales bacterium]|nr:hypothetical protein [Phycisphaerae bacterium]
MTTIEATRTLPVDPKPADAAIAPAAVEQVPAESALRIWTHRIIALLLATGMSIAAFWLYTRNNDFPYYFHPDEFKKGGMLMAPDQPRTFAHPGLMLEAANMLRLATHAEIESDLQAAVELGRRASAGMAALATFTLALAAFRLHGYAGLLIGGATVALCPPLLVHAHYFKEDATLIGAVGLTILAAVLIATSKPRLWTQLLAVLLLAIGCAAAGSAKYVGLAMTAPALIALLIAPNRRFWHAPVRLVLFLAVAGATFLAINFRAFTWENGSLVLNPGIQENVQWEVDHGMTGHYNLALKIPNTFTLRIARSDLMPHVWVFASLGVLWLIVRHRISRAGIVMLSFLLAWIVLLSRNAIPIPRYALPITVLAFFIASLLLSKLVYDMQLRWPVVGTIALVVSVAAVVVLQGQRCVNFNQQFLDDSRQRLRVWLAGNIPNAGMIAVDSYTGLQEPGDIVRFPDTPPLGNIQIPMTMYAADIASDLQGLADSGVEYVAVAWPGYMRFLDPEVRGWPEGSYADALFNRRRAFYVELFAKGQVAFESVPNPPTHSYVNPQVAVYRIKHLARPGTPRAVPQRQPPSMWQRIFG